MMPSFEGNLLTQRQQICSQETRDYHMVKARSLYLIWASFGTGRVVTDRQTDNIIIANTWSRVKIGKATDQRLHLRGWMKKW